MTAIESIIRLPLIGLPLLSITADTAHPDGLRYCPSFNIFPPQTPNSNSPYVGYGHISFGVFISAQSTITRISCIRGRTLCA